MWPLKVGGHTQPTEEAGAGRPTGSWPYRRGQEALDAEVSEAPGPWALLEPVGATPRQPRVPGGRTEAGAPPGCQPCAEHLA